MNLRSYVKSSNIAIHPSLEKDLSALPVWTSHSSTCYTVEGVSVGSTYLIFNATTREGKVVASQPKEIQVFDPLNLLPENVTLIPTATFQVSDPPRVKMGVA